MGSLRWRKVTRDLWHNKTRTILVVISIAIGVFAVGMILHTALLVATQVQADYRQSNPAHAIVYAGALDDDMIGAIRTIPGVLDAEGRSSTTVRVRTSADDWSAIIVRTFADIDDIRIERVLPVSSFDAVPTLEAERGTWPPGSHDLIVERSSFLLPNMMPANLRIGDTIELETLAGKRRSVTLSGLAHEPNSIPATFMGQAIAYVDQETFEWLGGGKHYDQVNVITTASAQDSVAILAIAKEVEEKIERSGRTVYAKEVVEPGKSPRDTILQGMIGMMFPLGLMSLLLSSFLVINTINALMSQHVRQVGMMKAIGGRNDQIAIMYFGMVALFGVLALLVAVPLAAYVTGITADLLAGFLNTAFPAYSLPPAVLALELVIGLIVPLLAAARPILKGTRITVREALSEYGVGHGRFGRSALDRLLSHVRLLSRPVLISLRNTFRRRGRLVLTLFTLILGGAIFIAVTNVRTSLTQTLDDALLYWQYDVSIAFNKGYRLDQIEQVARSMPEVAEVESWDFSALRRLREDGSESDNLLVAALPPATTMLSPTLIDGRWLLPGDENAIVINQEVAKTEEDIGIGDTMTFKIDGRETDWVVVGIASVIGSGRVAYVPYPYYSHIARNVDRASQVQVVFTSDDEDVITSASAALEDAYEAAGFQVAYSQTVVRIREQNEFYFRIIVVLLLIMAVMIAAVGALGLTGTMSINVLERTREIGVMRAIGASNGMVRNIVLTEGVLIGLISWMVGAVVAMPLGRIMSNGVGFAFFQMPLSYAASPDGIGLWLIIVLVLSVLASLLPARNASRLTVRETLAYE